MDNAENDLVGPFAVLRFRICRKSCGRVAAVPPECLVAGENVFTVSNRFVSGAGTKWTRYSEYVIEVKRVYGLSVVVR